MASSVTGERNQTIVKKATDRGCQKLTVETNMPIPHFYDSKPSWKTGCKVNHTTTRPFGLISHTIRKSPEQVGKGYEMSEIYQADQMADR